MIEFKIFNLIFTIWLKSYYFGNKGKLRVVVPREIEYRVAYWKVWSESSKQIINDDNTPF